MRHLPLAVMLAALALPACNRERTEGGLPTHRLVIPTDERPAVRADITPGPVLGGTLLVTRDGTAVLAADPDRDRVDIVDVASASQRSTIVLRPGDRPHRMTEGADGTAYLALRGSGEIATIDVATESVTARRRACPEPRGLAFDSALDALHVACASGELVTFTGASETPSRTVRLDVDLRDVVIHDGRVFVSRFKTGELLEVGADGALVDRTALLAMDILTFEGESAPFEGESDTGFDGTSATEVRTRFEPGVAWRAAATPDGATVIVHQRALAAEVELEPPTPQQPTSYGGGDEFSCDGIVQSAVSIVDHSTGTRRTTTVANAVLPVDVAVSSTGLVAIASAGITDPSTPRPFVEPIDPGSDHGGDVPAPESRGASMIPTGGVSILFREEISDVDVTFCRFSSFFAPLPQEPIVAVAFVPGGDELLVAQTREPAALHIASVFAGDVRTVPLGGGSRLDTGHEIFHRDTGAGIACASCHPEGSEDGRTWRFAGMGPRRTQALDVGLAGTAPFHWDGTLAGLDALMEEVFVGRMGGVHQTGERLEALESWLFSLEARAPMLAPEDPAAVRGQAVFTAAACGTCHSGAALTNNATVDVGTGEAFQVPSLVGIGYRAPFIHTGCAETLRDRFDPECGGAAHGDLAGLTDADLDDLVAYLETL